MMSMNPSSRFRHCFPLGTSLIGLSLAVLAGSTSPAYATNGFLGDRLCRSLDSRTFLQTPEYNFTMQIETVVTTTGNVTGTVGTVLSTCMAEDDYFTCMMNWNPPYNWSFDQKQSHDFDITSDADGTATGQPIRAITGCGEVRAFWFPELVYMNSATEHIFRSLTGTNPQQQQRLEELGVQVAIAHFQVNGPTTITMAQAGSISYGPITTQSLAGPKAQQIIRGFAYRDDPFNGPSLAGILRGSRSIQTVGAVTDNPSTNTATISDSFPWPTGPGGDLTLLHLSFNDSQFDLNDDGRFSEDDAVLARANIIGSTDPDEIARFDLNASGTVTSADIDVLDAIVTAGADSGLFGDSNGDGVVDCADRMTWSFFQDSILDDGVYLIQLDYDLNGHITADDLAAADYRVPTSDLDDGSGMGVRDAAVTIDDLLYFNTEFSNGTLGADVDNGTGTGVKDQAVTIDDLIYFLTLFGNGC